MLLFTLVLTTSFVFAQKRSQNSDIKVAMNTESWTSKEGKIKFGQHNGVQSLEIPNGSELATTKNIVFSNGVIEFDIEFIEGFTLMYFRYESDDESEVFYLREVNDPNAMEALQYSPVIKKVLIWDLLPHFQAAASFRKNEWTHVKLVVSGSQMLVYVNDKTRPALQIPRLEGNTKQGSIGFSGHCFVSNMVIKPNDTEGLSATEGFDPTYHDNRYLKNWQVTQPIALPRGQELTDDNVPGITTQWQKITAERRGMINLTRLYGLNESRRYVWLRTTLNSKTDQKRKLDLGFSEEVWVFVNENLTYVDKNLFTQEIRKEPKGRMSIGNTSFDINLKAGDNDILIGVADNFYGWGIIARLNDLEGITPGEYKPETVNKEFEQYFGTYASKEGPLTITISQKNNRLTARVTGQAPLLLEKSADGVYRYDPYNVTIEFVLPEKKMVLKEGTQSMDLFRQ
jgi:hypothetical protein